jgi:hypothetical protein
VIPWRTPVEIDEPEQRIDSVDPAVAVVRGEQFQVLPAGQVRVERRRLDEAADALERGRNLRLRVAPEQTCLACRRPDQSKQDP